MIIYIIRIKKVIKIKLYLRYGDTYLVSKSKICEKVKYNVYPISMRLKLTNNHWSCYCNLVSTLKKNLPIRKPYLWNLNFDFMKTANIPVCGNIGVYIKYWVVCLKIDYTLRCSVSSPLRPHGLSMCSRPCSRSIFYVFGIDDVSRRNCRRLHVYIVYIVSAIFV